MIHPHEQFAAKHMGWQAGSDSPTEEQIVEAIEQHNVAKKTLRQQALTKLALLGLTDDEIAALVG